MNTLAARGLEELYFHLCVSVFGSGQKQVLVLHTYVLRVQYSCSVVLVFLVLAGNSFWCYVRTQCTIQLCGCVSFLAMVGNRSQNENRFLQKKSYWVTLLSSASRCVYFIRPNTLLLFIFLFCIFLLYRADSQVEFQIRILPKDKYRKSCQKCERRQSHFDFLNNAYWVSLFQRNNL